MITSRLQLTVLSVTLLAACGEKEAAAPAPVPTTQVAPAAAPVADATLGKSVYGRSCAMCHAVGAAGAPKPGDKADWAPRIAQGMDLLHKHAREGYTGSKGQMPARGGVASLSDEEVKAAVVFMVEQSR